MIQRGRVGGLHGGPVQAIGNAVPFMDRPESSGRNRLQRTAVWPGGSQGDVVKKSRAFWAGCGVCETLGGQVAGQQGSGGLAADRRMSGGLSLLRCLARRRQEAKGVRGGE